MTFLESYIAANEATDCIYFQWRAELVVGVPQLEGHRIDMHITLMYMHVEPRWREVLAGMQEQWAHFRKASSGVINHTESSWVLSKYSDEHRGMLELVVRSRLYTALLQTVAFGVQKLPIPNRPDQWRLRNEFHLSVLAS